MKKTAILLTVLASSLSFASSHERHPEIQKFDEFKAPKGYVLSVDLHYTKMCSKIWTEQIKEFKKQNPTIKDPNIIAINQHIKVQDCRIQEAEVLEEVIAEAPAQTKQVAKKEERKRELFLLLSGQLNKAAEGSGNFANEGEGLKLEIGKYFKMSETRQVKASLGVLFNNTRMIDSDDKFSQIVGTGDVSYLFKLSNKVQLGPNLGILTGNGFVNESNQKSLAGFAGVNLDYSLSEKFLIDVKVQNALESRQNIYTTFGLGYKF
jgi:hypothetical protein